jgi:hypothetical protein
MTSNSIGDKIKGKLKEAVGMGEEAGHDIKDKANEELGPGAATKVEDQVAKTSSDSPTKKVEGVGKALGKEEGTE